VYCTLHTLPSIKYSARCLHTRPQGPALNAHLLLVLLELRSVGHLQGHSQGGDGVVVGATLQALRSNVGRQPQHMRATQSKALMLGLCV